jgi:amino acid transporter
MTTPSTTVVQLRRRRLGMIHIVFFTLTAVAPLSVLAGSIVPTYALSGVTAYPLAIVLIAIPLAIFSVGYAAMSRYVANAGAFYSYLAHGLGPTMAVAGAFVALVAYNGLQIAIYGVWGPVVADFVSQDLGLSLPWWTYAAAAVVIVGVLGVLRIDLNATVLAIMLVAEVVIVVVFYDVGAFTHPADGAALTAAWSPSSLFVPGAGAVFALGVSAFTGFEQGAIYGEEVHNPRVTVARATFATLTAAVLMFAVSSWAMLVTVGASDIQKAATENGPALVFISLEQFWGPVVASVANILFFTGIFASLLSFHNGIARYFFALGREHVLPSWLGRVGVRSGGPAAGSLMQTALAAVLILVFALVGADPLLQMYTWLAALSSVAILVLMAATSVAIIGFFRKRRSPESTWHRTVAPALATVGLLALLVIVVGNFDALGIDPSSPLRWALPGLVLVAIILGVVRARRLRSARPDAYAAIGTTGMSTDDDDGFVKNNQPRHSQWR